MSRLTENIETINAFMRSYQKEWSLVVKVLGTDKAVLTPLLNHPAILEAYRKESQPDGVLSEAGVGQTADDEESKASSYKAVMDFGILDVDAEYLVPEDPEVKFFGNSSDLTVYDLGDNPNHYKVGDVLRFRLRYMALAKLMYSRFVEKKISEE